jgi:hypothetical protein
VGCRSIASDFGLHATFMPKPVFGINGSGMHTNQSLFNLDGTNAFFDEKDRSSLSEVAYKYIAGIMKNAQGFCAVTNPLVNSYKRLVAGYEAPVYVAWSASNRSALVRIPASRGLGTRTEVRCPDPTCNPYLAFAMMLNSGLDGIKNNLPSRIPVNVDIFEMTPAEKEEAGIASLPANLYEAIQKLKNNPIAKESLGPHILEKYIEGKEKGMGQSLVDPDTAAHSRPLKVVKDVLVLEVDNSAWMQQLRFQKLHLLELLNSQLGIARFSDIRFTLRGKEPEQQGRPAATVRFEPPPADQVAAFKEQIEIIEDEASRESLLRLWYLAHACRRD